jgi:hypothetical protein
VTDLPYCLPQLEANVTANSEALARAGGSALTAAMDWRQCAAGGIATDAADGAAETEPQPKLEPEPESGSEPEPEPMPRLLLPEHATFTAGTEIVLAADSIYDAALVPPLFASIHGLLGQCCGCSAVHSGSEVDDAATALCEGCVRCCCQMHPLGDEEVAAEAAVLSDELGLADFGCTDASLSADGADLVSSEHDWATSQLAQGRPFALLAYTHRLDTADAALVAQLDSGDFCSSEVPCNRLPWMSFGDGQLDYSDESAPPVRVLRVQLRCGRRKHHDLGRGAPIAR